MNEFDYNDLPNKLEYICTKISFNKDVAVMNLINFLLGGLGYMEFEKLK